MEDIWKDVVGYEGIYKVSNTGFIKSVKSNIVMIKRQNNMGYDVKGLRKNNVTKHFGVHRLLAKAFIHNPHNLKYINHINSIRNDNRVENLEWCTAQYNVAVGMRAKLRYEDILFIRNSDKTYKQLSIDFGVGEPHISRIKSEKNWRIHNEHFM